MLFFLLLPGIVSGTMTSLDNVVPYLTTESRQFEWGVGGDALRVAASSFVRVNQRGVITQPPDRTVRDLGSIGWQVYQCLPGGNSLCEISNTSRVFPMDPDLPRFSARHRPAPLKCTRDFTHRILDTHWGYDISACDVLDSGGDIVFHQRQVAIKNTEISTWKYWTLCVLTVFIVRSFSTKVKARHDANLLQLSPDQYTIGACCLSTLLVITPDFTSELVTSEDLVSCCFLVCYSTFYVLTWCSFRHETNASIYNLIASTVLLTTCRLYKTIDTPFTPFILYVVASRTLMKLRNGFRFFQCVTVCADSMLISLLIVYGCSIKGVYVIIIAILAFATSDWLVS